MKTRETKYFIELSPAVGMRLTNKEKTEVYESSIYLPKNAALYTNIDSYIEITEEEAQQIIATIEGE